MGATGFGKGLAVRHDFRADIQNLYERENLKTQIQVEKQRKAEYYGNMLKQGHVRGPAATKRLEQHYDQLNNQLADFVTENPDWETDPGKFSQFINITDGYLNNDIIREDLQVQKQYEALQAESQRGTLTRDEIMAETAKYDNYIQNGGDPYVFVNPKKFEYEDILKADVQGVGYSQDVQYKEGEGGLYMQRTVKAPKASSIQAQVRDRMANPDMRRSIEAQWKAAGGYDVAPTAAKYYENDLRARTDFAASTWSYDQYQLRKATSGAEKGIGARSVVADYYDHYNESMRTGQNIETTPSANAIYMTGFGKIGGFYHVTETSNFKIKDKNGEFIDFGYTANMKAKGSRQMTFPGTGNQRRPYVGVDVEFAIPLDKDGDPVDSSMHQWLVDNDFVSSKVTQYAQFDFTGLGETKKHDAQVYKGVVYAPAEFTFENMIRVDSNADMSIEEERALRESGLYDDILIIDKLEQRTPGTRWRINQDGDYVSLDGKYLYKKDQDQFYSINNG